MKKAMRAFLCGGLALVMLLFAAGCQSPGSGGSLKAEQIVFDTECEIAVTDGEKELTAGILKNSAAETVFSVTAPEAAKGLCYQESGGEVHIDFQDLSLNGAQAVLPQNSWFLQLTAVLRFAQEQPQLLEPLGGGRFSGSTEQGTEFVLTAGNKGTLLSISIDRYHIQFK